LAGGEGRETEVIPQAEAYLDPEKGRAGLIGEGKKTGRTKFGLSAGQRKSKYS